MAGAAAGAGQAGMFDVVELGDSEDGGTPANHTRSACREDKHRQLIRELDAQPDIFSRIDPFKKDFKWSEDLPQSGRLQGSESWDNSATQLKVYMSGGRNAKGEVTDNYQCQLRAKVPIGDNIGARRSRKALKSFVAILKKKGASNIAKAFKENWTNLQTKSAGVKPWRNIQESFVTFLKKAKNDNGQKNIFAKASFEYSECFRNHGLHAYVPVEPEDADVLRKQVLVVMSTARETGAGKNTCGCLESKAVSRNVSEKQVEREELLADALPDESHEQSVLNVLFVNGPDIIG